MSTITTINATDRLVDSRSVINTNFSNLNSDKAEKSNNLSDMTVPNTALNNILPSQTGKLGKVLGSDGSNTSWVDPSGSPLSTNIVQGITALTCVAANPLLPKAVGDNDPRMLTTDQKAAAAGTGSPSGANKFVTADTDALKELLTNKDTTVTLGTSDTKYPSQNAVKTYVDNQIPAVAVTVCKTGLSQRLADATTGSVNIAHGLGKIPKLVRFTANILQTVQPGTVHSFGTYDGTHTVNVYTQLTNQGFGSSSSSTTNVITVLDNNSDGQTATVTMDATNITLAWTKSGTHASVNINVLWEAIG